MTRESYILLFQNSISMTKKQTIPISRCATIVSEQFPVIDENVVPFLQLMWKSVSKCSDNITLPLFVKTMQHLDNLYFKVEKINGHVLFTTIYYSLASTTSTLMLDPKIIVEFFKSVGQKDKSGEVKTLLDNNANTVQLEQFLEIMNDTYKLTTMPVNEFLQEIKFKSYVDYFSKLAILLEVIIEDVLRLVQRESFNSLQTQAKVLVKLSAKDKKFMTLNEFVAMSKELEYIVDKIGSYSVEVLFACEFRILDKDYSASLDIKELTKLFKLSNMETKKKYVLNCIKEYDSNGDGVIQIDEMLDMLRLFMKKKTSNNETFLINLNASTKHDIINETISTPTLPDSSWSIRQYSLKLSHLSKSIQKKTTPSDKYSYSDLTQKVLEICEKENKIVEQVTQLLFEIGDQDKTGSIEAWRFNTIIEFIEKTKGIVTNEKDLYRICFKVLSQTGEIDVNQLMFITEKLGMPISNKNEAMKMLIMHDSNNIEMLDEDQFISLLTDDDEIHLDDTIEESELKTKRIITKSFRVADSDRDGLINQEEAESILLDFWGELSLNNKQCVQFCFLLYGKNKTINTNEFLEMCLWMMPLLDDSGELEKDEMYQFLFDECSASKTLIDAKNFTYLLSKIQIHPLPNEILSLLEKYGESCFIGYDGVKKCLDDILFGNCEYLFNQDMS
ncbi:EF-hand domain-containing protein [Entamoeba marina]